MSQKESKPTTSDEAEAKAEAYEQSLERGKTLTVQAIFLAGHRSRDEEVQALTERVERVREETLNLRDDMRDDLREERDKLQAEVAALRAEVERTGQNVKPEMYALAIKQGEKWLNERDQLLDDVDRLTAAADRLAAFLSAISGRMKDNAMDQQIEMLLADWQRVSGQTEQKEQKHD